MTRANWIGAPEFFNLNHACQALNESFGYCNFLVGSSLERRDFRDVDIRCILSDEKFDKLFDGMSGNYTLNGRWSLMCASISCWLSDRSGLNIDFQIQKQSEANAEFDGPRHALGLFIK